MKPSSPLARNPVRSLPATPVASDLQLIGDLLKIALRHKLVLALWLLAGAAGGTAYYFASKPLYQAKAQVLVAKREPRNFTAFGGQMTSMEDDVAVHVALLASPVFIRRVVEQQKLGALPTFQGVPDPCEAIIPSLTVTRDVGDPGRGGPSAGILSFSYKGPIPEDCPKVVNAIIGAYQGFLEETSGNMNEQALGLLTRKAETVRRDVRAAEEKYQQFRRQMPALVWEGKERTDASPGHSADLETKRADLILQRAKAENRLAAVERAAASGADATTIMALVGESSRKDSFAAMESALVPLLLQEKALLEDFGPDHPDVQAVRKKIELLKDFYAPSSTTRANLGAEPAEPPDAKQLAAVKAYTQLLQHELEDIRSSEKALAALREEQNDQAKQMQSYQFEDRQLSSDITRLDQFYQSLVDQLHSVDVSSELVGYSMNVISPPTTVLQVAPRWWMVAIISLALAVAGGGGTVGLLHISDRSFHDAAEVTRRLGLPVVAHLPLVQGPKPQRVALAASRVFDPVLCTYHQPASPEAETYRSLRTALYFSRHGARPKVIQITSPNPGDGKTATISNLAVSLAQLGRKVLLIDADLHWPRLHEIFGLSAELGLAAVINGTAEPQAVIQESGIDGLSILPGGATPPNPADLLTSPRFKELLDQMREQYDFVLVDTPAFLSVTDARIVAPQVDGVLLTIRVTKNGRPRVERCCEILSTFEANLLGVTVNGKDRHRYYEMCDMEQYHAGYLEPYRGNGASAQKPDKQPPEHLQRLSSPARANSSTALLPPR